MGCNRPVTESEFSRLNQILDFIPDTNTSTVSPTGHNYFFIDITQPVSHSPFGCSCGQGTSCVPGSDGVAWE